MQWPRKNTCFKDPGNPEKLALARASYLEKAELFPKKLAYELLANINSNQ
jgi:hypothetical protein